MKPIELVTKLLEIKRADFASEYAIATAVTAFLGNLIGALKVELPKDYLVDKFKSERLLFYVGVIVGRESEIPSEAIRDAHIAMILPSTRAIISRLLYGPGMVTPQGVPSSYGV